jgi:hypothetical protein
MANKKISNLPLKTALAETDFVPVVDTAITNFPTTKRTTLASIKQLIDPITQAEKGVAGGVPTLDPVTAKIPTEQLPAIAINDTFVVNSSTELTTLTAEIGDVAVRADLNKSFILASAPASNINNWVELLASGIPTNNSLDGGNF